MAEIDYGSAIGSIGGAFVGAVSANAQNKKQFK